MSSSKFKLEASDFDRLQKAIEQYPGNAEEAINEVLHGEAGDLLQDAIRQFMPVSGRDWKGKAKAAKYAKSLQSVPNNLAITVSTMKKYQYLYFPDDGSNTQNTAHKKWGQHFFARGEEAVHDEIVNRCLARLTQDFEKEL